jgi:hypothetical protein
MAHVKVDQGPPDDARLPELPLDYQRLHASSRGGRVLRALHKDCRGLADLLAEAEEAGWAGLGSRDAFIIECLGRPVDVIDMALNGVRLFDLSEPVPLDKAVKAEAARRMAETEALTKHGEVGNGRSRVDDVNSTSDSKGGNSADYLAARIKRDRPDIAARVEAGEFRSMRAAALEAGIIKPPCPVKVAKRAVEKMDEDQLADFFGWLDLRNGAEGDYG